MAGRATSLPFMDDVSTDEMLIDDDHSIDSYLRRMDVDLNGLLSSVDLEQTWQASAATLAMASMPGDRNLPLTPLPAFPGAPPQHEPPLAYAQASGWSLPPSAACAQQSPAGAAPQAHTAAQHNHQAAAPAFATVAAALYKPDASLFVSGPAPWGGPVSAPPLGDCQQPQCTTEPHTPQVPASQPAAPGHARVSHAPACGFAAPAPGCRDWATAGVQGAHAPVAATHLPLHAQHPHVAPPAHALPQPPTDTPADLYTGPGPLDGSEPPPPGVGNLGDAAQRVRSGSGDVGGWQRDSGGEGDVGAGVAGTAAGRDEAEGQAQLALATKTKDTVPVAPPTRPSPARRGRRGVSARTATAERKQINRKAQQKYREKKKGQDNVMEKQVAELTASLEKLRPANEQAQALLEEYQGLRAALAWQLQTRAQSEEKQAEARALLELLDADPHDSCDTNDPVQTDGAHASADANTVTPTSAPTIRAQYDQLVARLSTHQREMRELMRAAGVPLDTVRPDQQVSGAHLDAIVAKLAQMTQVSLHLVVLVLKCPKSTLYAHRAATEAKHMGEHYRAHFNPILKAVHLEDSQYEAWVAARTTAVDRLRELAEERKALERVVADVIAARMPVPSPRQARHSDAVVAAAAAPADVRGAGASPPPPGPRSEGSNAVSAGSERGAATAACTCSPEELNAVEAQALRHEVECGPGGEVLARFGSAAVAPLGIAFYRLRANLCLERRCYLRLHETIMKQVLRPLQAAVLFVQTDTNPDLPMGSWVVDVAQRGTAGMPKPTKLGFECTTQERPLSKPSKRDADGGGTRAQRRDSEAHVCDSVQSAKHSRTTRSRGSAAARGS